MTAEIVVPGRSNEIIPPGTDIYWLDESGNLIHLDSFSQHEGFRVVVGDNIKDALVVTLENKRQFLLPNGQMVIPG